MADDEETRSTEEHVKYLIAKGESLEGLLTVFMCEVHNQMPRVKDPIAAGRVRLGTVRRAAAGIDVAEIAIEIEECIPDPTTGARLLTLALLNMMGAVEWVE